MFYLKIVQQAFITILGSEASVCQIAVDVSPLAQSPIIKHLQFVGNDKRNMLVVQAFFEHQQPPYTPVAVLKGMDSLKTHMEAKNVFKRRVFV